jgi:heme/copper-type cytochrome/quinol oxidase subunit 1
LLADLATLLGLPRFSLTRLALALALLAVATGLAITAFVELVDALRLALLTVLHPAWASLVTAGFILLLVVALGLVAWRLSRPLPAPARRAAGAAPADPALAQALRWVQGHPQQATVIAAVLGFVTGALPEVRRALQQILGAPPRKG